MADPRIGRVNEHKDAKSCSNSAGKISVKCKIITKKALHKLGLDVAVIRWLISH